MRSFFNLIFSWNLFRICVGTCNYMVSMLECCISLTFFFVGICDQIQVFEPFSILGLEPGASDSEIKKAYRRISIQYHPDKNPDPG